MQSFQTLPKQWNPERTCIFSFTNWYILLIPKTLTTRIGRWFQSTDFQFSRRKTWIFSTLNGIILECLESEILGPNCVLLFGVRIPSAKFWHLHAHLPYYSRPDRRVVLALKQQIKICFRYFWFSKIKKIQIKILFECF